MTTVGSAGPLSDSFYGTADQGGNVWEWNEALIGGLRGSRGGSFKFLAGGLRSSDRGINFPSSEDDNLGFRVATAPKPGDANVDGFVNGGDYTIWADHYLQTGQNWETGDFNGDGIVDGGDYTIWADNYAEAAMASAVPEPSTLALFGIGAVVLLPYTIRRRPA